MNCWRISASHYFVSFSLQRRRHGADCMGWSRPPHFFQMSFPRLMQIGWVLLGKGIWDVSRSGLELDSTVCKIRRIRQMCCIYLASKAERLLAGALALDHASPQTRVISSALPVRFYAHPKFLTWRCPCMFSVFHFPLVIVFIVLIRPMCFSRKHFCNTHVLSSCKGNSETDYW